MPNPHPGAEHYVDAFTKAITPQTKVISFTHVTSTVGDLFPAKEICRLARERGILSLVDGAQTFGLMDVDLSDMQPDFYSGSAHKWPCGPKENGVLYINKRVAVEDLGEHLQRLSGARRRLEDVRRVRPARRAGDDRLRRGAEVPDQDRRAADREASRELTRR